MITIDQATTTQHLDHARDLMCAFIDWHCERHHQEKELIDSYFDPDAFDAELASLPGEYAPPGGILLLATEDARPAGCVAFHGLGDGVCEMKRLFVYKEFHGRGLGRMLAQAIIDDATKAGYTYMRLDTGARQKEAQGLYTKLGFMKIDAYYELPTKLCEWLVFMELDLTSP